jgi:hypothetical protein
MHCSARKHPCLTVWSNRNTNIQVLNTDRSHGALEAEAEWLRQAIAVTSGADNYEKQLRRTETTSASISATLIDRWWWAGSGHSVLLQNSAQGPRTAA